MKKTNNKHWVEQVIDGVPEGMRHDSAVRLVGRWYGKGLCRAEVRMILMIWNQLNSPPLEDQEIKSIFDSTTKWERPRDTFFMSQAEAREIVREVRKEVRKRRRYIVHY